LNQDPGCPRRRPEAWIPLVPGMAVALWVLTIAMACGSATGATAPFLPIGGTYAVTVVIAESAVGSLIRSDTVLGQLSFSAASRTGAFTGSYGIDGIQGNSAGQEKVDGSLHFSEFGQPIASPPPPLEDDLLIEHVVIVCDWSTATGGQMTGRVVQADGGLRSLTITGSVQVVCTPPPTLAPVTATVTLDAVGVLEN
jgi:hypothetical protein